MTTISNSGLLGLVAMITATTSGLSYLLALGGLTMIRGWNRMSIVIGFLGVIGLVVGLSVLADRVRMRRSPKFERRAMAATLVAMLAIGAFDQTSPNDGRSAAGVRAAWDNDAAFFSGIEAALPSGSAVYQFPEAPFPEGGSIGHTGLYDGARAYVHAPTLKWSFGAVLGRHPDRPADLASWEVYRIADYLHEQGFRAIVVDRFGYDDMGVDLVDRLWALGSTPTQSTDGRYVWFDIGSPPG